MGQTIQTLIFVNYVQFTVMFTLNPLPFGEPMRIGNCELSTICKTTFLRYEMLFPLISIETNTNNNNNNGVIP